MQRKKEAIMTYASGKPKPDSRTPAWLDTLIGPLYLDFVAPYPLESCLKLLKNQETEGFFRYRKVKVDLIPEDGDTFGFYLKRWGSKYGTIEAHGLLKRWEADSTVVSARVNVAARLYLAYFAIMAVMLFLMGPFLIRMAWMMPLFIGVMILNWFIARQRRMDVVKLIENTFLSSNDEP
jgi:hypothetical protein